MTTIPPTVAEAAKQRRSLAYNSKNGAWTDSTGLVLDADEVRELDRTLADFAISLIEQAGEEAITEEWCRIVRVKLFGIFENGKRKPWLVSDTVRDAQTYLGWSSGGSVIKPITVEYKEHTNAK